MRLYKTALCTSKLPALADLICADLAPVKE